MTALKSKINVQFVRIQMSINIEILSVTGYYLTTVVAIDQTMALIVSPALARQWC